LPGWNNKLRAENSRHIHNNKIKTENNEMPHLCKGSTPTFLNVKNGSSGLCIVLKKPADLGFPELVMKS
jgi:hypothetical protein